MLISTRRVLTAHHRTRSASTMAWGRRRAGEAVCALVSRRTEPPAASSACVASTVYAENVDALDALAAAASEAASLTTASAVALAAVPPTGRPVELALPAATTLPIPPSRTLTARDSQGSRSSSLHQTMSATDRDRAFSQFVRTRHARIELFLARELILLRGRLEAEALRFDASELARTALRA